MEKQETDLYSFVNHGSIIYCLFSCSVGNSMVEKIFAKFGTIQGYFWANNIL